MITCTSESSKYRCTASNGEFQLALDAPEDKGGKVTGLRTNELLEAALASCMNTQLRMYADQQGFSLTGVTVTVKLDNDSLSDAVFKYSVELEGELNSQEKKLLMQSVLTSPVRQTLSKNISVQYSSKL